MKTEIPPIPKHPRFRMLDGVPQYRAGWVWVSVAVLGGTCREDCVCVARCAWLDEAERQGNLYNWRLEKYGRQNADAWKEWGKQK